jgi:hypothetical protein
MSEKPGHDHWLVRPANIRRIWIAFIALLAVLVLLDLLIAKHPHFEIEGTFGFGAWYGFIACAVLVFGSKALAIFLKRPDTYYDE